MDKDTEKHISCGIIPVYVNEKHEHQFLLVEACHGGIGFPKGHIETGETFLQTAARELLEETGLVCSHVDTENMISEKYIIKGSDGDIDKTVHYFIGFVGSKKVTKQDEEIKNYFWLSPQDAVQKINHAESRQVCKKAIEILEK
ncbi:MAG: NUDIX domain-containing protein [Minisyncoccia bacterium]